MIQTFKNAFKSKEVRNKILMTLLLVAIYRLGSFIPIPGLTISTELKDTLSSGFFGVMSAITGGALANGTLFAIGISPYINASIIVQLLTVAIPPLERLARQGDEGRKKLTKITRFATLILATVQAVGILFAYQGAGILNYHLFGTGNDPVPEWIVFIFVALILVAGACLCMWIGERITEYGISNGMSLLIFVGILATAGQQIIQVISSIIENGWTSGGWELIGFLGMTIIIFAFIVLVDKAERKITVQYAKQIKGNKMYGGQSTNIPIRVNGSGVLPLIFAFALTSFPELLFNTFWSGLGGLVYFVSRHEFVRLPCNAYAVYLLVCVLLSAGSIQPCGSFKKHTKQRRIYPGYQAGTTYGRISDKGYTENHFLRRTVFGNHCFRTYHSFQSDRCRHDRFAQYVQRNRYAHRSFRRFGIR